MLWERACSRLWARKSRASSLPQLQGGATRFRRSADPRELFAAETVEDAFDADDVRWLRRRRPAPQGRFNAGQKLNASLTAAFTVLFAVSGLLLWLGERDTRFRFASTVILHDGLMFTALALFVGHLYLAVLHPATRHSLRGITRGSVREDWARVHYPRWTESQRG